MNDSIPLHPAIVHLPLALGFLMPILALLVFVALKRERLTRLAGWGTLLFFQTLLVAGGYGAIMTGEEDEELVERIVSETVLERHEHAAERFLWAGAATCLLIVIGTASRSKRLQTVFAAASFIAMLAVGVLGLRTGKIGGEIVYIHGAAQIHSDRAHLQQATELLESRRDDGDSEYEHN